MSNTNFNMLVANGLTEDPVVRELKTLQPCSYLAITKKITADMLPIGDADPTNTQLGGLDGPLLYRSDVYFFEVLNFQASIIERTGAAKSYSYQYRTLAEADAWYRLYVEESNQKNVLPIVHLHLKGEGYTMNSKVTVLLALYPKTLSNAKILLSGLY